MVGAQEDDGATQVTVSATDAAAGSAVAVSGSVSFGTDVWDDVFATEGSGGQIVPSQLGTDIVGATITSDPARAGELTFGIQLAEMPPVIGGVGEGFDWSLLPGRLERPVILSGGLSRENVAEAIRRVRPWGVDVSSGVESAKGVKDGGKIAAFIAEVRNADV
jgi:hypothetical protein